MSSSSLDTWRGGSAPRFGSEEEDGLLLSLLSTIPVRELWPEFVEGRHRLFESLASRLVPGDMDGVSEHLLGMVRRDFPLLLGTWIPPQSRTASGGIPTGRTLSSQSLLREAGREGGGDGAGGDGGEGIVKGDAHAAAAVAAAGEQLPAFPGLGFACCGDPLDLLDELYLTPYRCFVQCSLWTLTSSCDGSDVPGDGAGGAGGATVGGGGASGHCTAACGRLGLSAPTSVLR